MAYKINYEKLRNLKQTNYFLIVIFAIFIFLFLFLFSYFINIKNKIVCLGIYQDNILTIQINDELSDKIKNNNVLYFNNSKMTYKINNFSDYYIENNNVYQNIELIVDKELYNNEVGKVEFNYNKVKLINYIFTLFK